MTTLQIAISQTTLLDAANALDVEELDQLLDALLRLRARRIAPSVFSAENTLIERIHRATLPTDEHLRLQALSTQLELATLTENEYAEWVILNDKSESFNVERMQAVAELAIKRGESLQTVLADLGLLNNHDA